MKLTSDTVDILQQVAGYWSQGVAVLQLFEDDYLILAVTSVVQYDPSNNIYYTTIRGKNITQLVTQKLQIASERGVMPISNYVEDLPVEYIWELTPGERWYWLKANNLTAYARR